MRHFPKRLIAKLLKTMVVEKGMEQVVVSPVIQDTDSVISELQSRALGYRKYIYASGASPPSDLNGQFAKIRD